ncbi:MAG TPA: hypothetical protein PKA82_09515 [Pyrinomonadaceae bacterium]|nr:hypothetical protein [Pyrinomonadaceae bacterium]
METVTFYLLWLFVIVQIPSLLKAYAVFGTPSVSLARKVITAIFYVIDVVFFVLLGLKLLDVLASGMIDPIWLLLLFSVAGFVGQIVRLFVEHYLLGKPLPTFKAFFS